MAATDSTKQRTVKERFDYAVSIIRSLPKDGPFQPSNMMKLKFYGLFKQATLGSNDTPKPGFWDPTARAKWEAWTLCGDMTGVEAMKLYIRELEQISETMPQTEEVKEFLKMIRHNPQEPSVQSSNKELEKQSTNKEEATNNGTDGGQVEGERQLAEEGDGQGQEEGEGQSREGVGQEPSTGNEQSRGDESVDSEDDEDDIVYEDSYDNLPTTTSTPPSGTAYHSSTPNPRQSSSQTHKDLTDFTPDNSYSPITATTYTSASAIAPSNDSDQSNHAVVGSTPGGMGVAKEVRFSDTVSYSVDRSDETSSRILEKVYDMQQKLQVLIQQFNNLVQLVSQQQQSTTRIVDDRSHGNRRRRGSSLMLFMNHLIPVISILITSFFYHLMTGNTSFPWWLASAVTICSVFISNASLYLFH